MFLGPPLAVCLAVRHTTKDKVCRELCPKLCPELETGFRRCLPVVLRMHILSAFGPRCVSGEQRGGATEILSQGGVEHGERAQFVHPRVGLELTYYRDRVLHGVKPVFVKINRTNTGWVIFHCLLGYDEAAITFGSHN
jgi:hypothetical protein